MRNDPTVLWSTAYWLEISRPRGPMPDHALTIKVEHTSGADQDHHAYRRRNRFERFFLSAQVIQGNCNPLRETRRQLPRPRKTRRHVQLFARL